MTLEEVDNLLLRFMDWRIRFSSPSNNTWCMSCVFQEIYCTEAIITATFNEDFVKMLLNSNTGK